MISTNANSENFLSNGATNETYYNHHQVPASAKPMHLGVTGAIHAPRHSFTKRSFGRDLMNIQ